MPTFLALVYGFRVHLLVHFAVALALVLFEGSVGLIAVIVERRLGPPAIWMACSANIIGIGGVFVATMHGVMKRLRKVGA